MGGASEDGDQDAVNPWYRRPDFVISAILVPLMAGVAVPLLLHFLDSNEKSTVGVPVAVSTPRSPTVGALSSAQVPAPTSTPSPSACLRGTWQVVDPLSLITIPGAWKLVDSHGGISVTFDTGGQGVVDYTYAETFSIHESGVVGGLIGGGTKQHGFDVTGENTFRYTVADDSMVLTSVSVGAQSAIDDSAPGPQSSDLLTGPHGVRCTRNTLTLSGATTLNFTRP